MNGEMKAGLKKAALQALKIRDEWFKMSQGTKAVCTHKHPPNSVFFSFSFIVSFCIVECLVIDFSKAFHYMMWSSLIDGNNKLLTVITTKETLTWFEWKVDLDLGFLILFDLISGCRDIPSRAGWSHMELHASGSYTGKIPQPQWGFSHSCWEQTDHPHNCKDPDPTSSRYVGTSLQYWLFLLLAPHYNRNTIE